MSHPDDKIQATHYADDATLAHIARVERERDEAHRARKIAQAELAAHRSYAERLVGFVRHLAQYDVMRDPFCEVCKEIVAVLAKNPEQRQGADSPYVANTDPSAAQDHAPPRHNAESTVGALQEATETPIAQSAPATHDAVNDRATLERAIAYCQGQAMHRPITAAHHHYDDGVAACVRMLEDMLPYPDEPRVVNGIGVSRSPSLRGLLVEARATLEMWKDVAPAVSLCRDIDRALAAPAPPEAVAARSQTAHHDGQPCPECGRTVHQRNDPGAMEHEQGCPALGGYGTSDRTCICKASQRNQVGV
jgi:uncharacterized protein with PIN domain